jgi:uncharacterized protein (DUF1697 family)
MRAPVKQRSAMTSHIALLRGINLGGHNAVPMTQLRGLAEALGWAEARTYIQSGNLVFAAGGKADALEAALENAIAQSFGIAVPVMVRSAAQWTAILAANPLAREAEAEPSRTIVAISKRPLTHGAAQALEAKGAAGERVREAGGALWFHYPEGLGKSKITPAMIDKAAGSPVTARNWRTALTLRDMAG